MMECPGAPSKRTLPDRRSIIWTASSSRPPFRTVASDPPSGANMIADSPVSTCRRSYAALVYRSPGICAGGIELLEGENGGAELGDVDGPDDRRARCDRRVGPRRGREPARGVDRGDGGAHLDQMAPLDDGGARDDGRV